MDDDEGLRRSRQRDIELAQTAVAVIRNGRWLDDHDVIELETLRLPRRQHRDGDLIEELALRQGARKRARHDHREQSVQLGERSSLPQCRRQ